MGDTDLLAVPEGLSAPAWPRRQPARQTVLECLSVVEGADALFLMRQTGLRPGEVRVHVRALASAGYVGAAGESSALVQLTDRGRAAQDATRRWRFKSAALVLLSALSRR